MNKLFSLLLLINGLTAIFALCPDSPTLPTSTITSSNQFVVTPTSLGMLNFPDSTKELTFMLTIIPDGICESGSLFNIFSLSITPPPDNIERSILRLQLNCSDSKLDFEVRGDLATDHTSGKAFSSSTLGPMSVAFTFSLTSKRYKMEYSTNTYRISYPYKSLQTNDTWSFDATTKIYICAGDIGTPISSCIVKNVGLFYSYVGSTYLHGYAGSSSPSISALYPLTDGPATSIKNTISSTSTGYFGDSASSPTSGTVPSWDFSNAFAKITAQGQFLTFPMPLVALGPEGYTKSLTISAWIRLTASPTTNVTIFSVVKSDGSAPIKLSADASTILVRLYFGSIEADYSSDQLKISLNTWNLIGVALVIRSDNVGPRGRIFIGQSVCQIFSTTTGVSLEATDLLRVGDASSSFIGDVSAVRVITPSAGFTRDSTLACNPLNGIELGFDPFALTCSDSASLSSLDNKCYSSCPSGTGPVTGTAVSLCVDCLTNCVQCNNRICQSCSTNYRLYSGDNTCYASSACPSKTYPNATHCVDCSTNCDQCDSSGCIQCDTNYLMYTGDKKCYSSSTCPSKTYPTSAQCVDCSANCAQCDSSGCIQCDTNYLMYTGDKKCYTSSTCPAKTYPNSTHCVDCSTNCDQCNSSGCQSCEASYLLYSGDKKCYTSSTCPSKTYPNSTQCVDCSANCAQCDSSGCIQCDTNYLMYTGDRKCYTSSTCPAKTYPNSTHCVDCSSNCGQCDSSGCQSCDAGFLLYNGDKKCYSSSTCPSKTYPTSAQCVDCSANCAQCDSSGCIQCDTNYLMYTGDKKCYTSSTCPSKTYVNSTNCVDCSANCVQCDSSGCQSCEASYLLYSGDKKCYSSSTCPAKTYPNSTHCVDCSANCAQCNSSGCQSCDSSYLFYSGDKKCYSSSSCPSKTYPNSTHCVDCSSNCVQCDSSGCQQCDTNYLINSGDKKCYLSSACPSKTYPNSTHCVDCSSNCAQCDSSGCQQCDSNYLMYAGDKKCYTSSTCPSKTYPNSSQCVDCSSNCAQCNSSGCQQCDTNYLMYSGDKKCYTSNSCPAKTYPNSTHCVDCSSNCAQCDSSGCQNCDTSYLLYNGDKKCYTNSACPSKTYPNATHCVDCSSNCNQCDSSGCLQCGTNYLMYTGDKKCYTSSTCPAKTYPNSTHCVDCSANCAQCNSSGCQQCDTNYLMYTADKKCYLSSTCPSKTYPNSSHCVDCSSNCAQCDSSGCQNCEAGYLVYSGNKQCYTSNSCPIKTYQNSTHCIDCSANCDQCNSSGCQQCAANYLMYIGDKKCYTNSACPSKTYPNLTNCVDCSANCAQCDSSGCRNCDANYLLYTGDKKCYASSTCPSKTYPNSTHCIDCSANCAQCDSSGCQQCDTNYLMYSGEKKCYSSGLCPAKTYPSSTHCVDCSANCAQCDSSGCRLCISPKVAINGACQCPSGTVENTTTFACDFVSYIDMIYQPVVSRFTYMYIQARIAPEEEASFPPVFSWTFTSSTAGSTAFTNLQTYLSSQKTKELVVPSEYLDANTNYNVKATYVNAQGKVVSKEVLIQTTGNEIQVSVRGGPSQTLDYSKVNTIAVEVISINGNIASSQLNVRWTQTTNYQLNIDALQSSQAPFLLTIPKCTLSLGTNYNFTVTIQEKGTSNAPKTADLAIVSLRPKLKVGIPDGNRGQKADLELRLLPTLSVEDECKKADLNTIVDTTTRQDVWECTKIDSQGVSSKCNDPLQIFNPPQGTASLTVPAIYFSQDVGAEFTFKLTVTVKVKSTAGSSTEDVLVATNKTSFTILAANSPSVTLTQKVFGVPSLYEVLLESTPPHNYTYAWEFTPDIQYVFFTNTLKVQSDLTVLAPLTSVRAKMMATNELGITTALYYQLPINQPPKGGSVNVLPTSGTSLDTVFFISTSGWIDEDIPFTYEFLYSNNEASGYKSLGAKQLASSITSQLVSDGKSSNISVKVIVTDTFGGSGANFTQATVTPSTDVTKTASAIQGLLSIGSDVSPAQMTSLLSLASESLASLETAYSSSSNSSAACPLCSGHGSCSNSNQCVCNVGYTLADCSMSQTQFDTITNTKIAALNAMMQTISGTDVDPAMKQAISESLESLSSSPTFNNVQSMTTAQNVIETVLNLNNPETILSSTESTSVSNILSNMLTYASLTDSSMASGFSQGLENKANQYIVIVSNSLIADKLPGENASVISTASFGIYTSKTTWCDLSSLNVATSQPPVQLSLSANGIPNPSECQMPLDVKLYALNASLFGVNTSKTLLSLDIRDSTTGQPIDSSKISVKIVPTEDQQCPVDCEMIKGDCLCIGLFDFKGQLAKIFHKSNIDKLGNVDNLLSSLLTFEFWKSLPVWSTISFSTWFFVSLFIIKKNPTYNIAARYRDTDLSLKSKIQKARILFLITHPILSIYFYVSPHISKVTKLILYYQQMIFLLAYTAIFPASNSEDNPIVSKIILILLKMVTVTPLSFIIAFLIRDPALSEGQSRTCLQRYQRKFGILLSIIATIGCVYIIFIVAAQTDPQVQKDWTLNFLIVLIQGLLVSPPVNLSVQISLISYLASSLALKIPCLKKKVLPRLLDKDIHKLYKRVYLGLPKTAIPKTPMTPMTPTTPTTEAEELKTEHLPTLSPEKLPQISIPELELDLELDEVPLEILSPTDLPSALHKAHNREIRSPKKSSASSRWDSSKRGSVDSIQTTHLNSTDRNGDSPINAPDSEDRFLKNSSPPASRTTRRSKFYFHV